MSRSNNILFNQTLKEIEKEYNTRPEFQYRLGRFKFDNFLRVPLAITFRHHTGGWFVKGLFLYVAYYILLKRRPLEPYLNRVGYYSYDSGHHTADVGPNPI